MWTADTAHVSHADARRCWGVRDSSGLQHLGQPAALLAKVGPWGSSSLGWISPGPRPLGGGLHEPVSAATHFLLPDWMTAPSFLSVPCRRPSGGQTRGLSWGGGGQGGGGRGTPAVSLPTAEAGELRAPTEEREHLGGFSESLLGGPHSPLEKGAGGWALLVHSQRNAVASLALGGPGPRTQVWTQKGPEPQLLTVLTRTAQGRTVPRENVAKAERK